MARNVRFLKATGLQRGLFLAELARQAGPRPRPRAISTRGIDLTVSARMTVDHGLAQPLEVLFGGIDRVPVFVSGVATSLGPVRRIRALGTAVGEAAATLDKRVQSETSTS